jgi:hypothetical protein
MNVTIIWDLDEGEQGTVAHLAEHGIQKDDVAHVFDHPEGFDKSDSSGRLIVFGYTIDTLQRYADAVGKRLEIQVIEEP